MREERVVGRSLVERAVVAAPARPDRKRSIGVLLLIEDNPGDTFLVEEALRTCAIPMDITVAEDGEKGLSLLTQGKVRPDLVILDLSLPKVSGISLLEQYHAKETAPVIVFSSTWSETDIRQALAFGAPLSQAFNRAQDMTDPGLILLAHKDVRFSPTTTPELKS
jgi:CheY-like chemotaxis protein